MFQKFINFSAFGVSLHFRILGWLNLRVLERAGFTIQMIAGSRYERLNTHAVKPNTTKPGGKKKREKRNTRKGKLPKFVKQF